MKLVKSLLLAGCLAASACDSDPSTLQFRAIKPLLDDPAMHVEFTLAIDDRVQTLSSRDFIVDAGDAVPHSVPMTVASSGSAKVTAKLYNGNTLVSEGTMEFDLRADFDGYVAFAKTLNGPCGSTPTCGAQKPFVIQSGDQSERFWILWGGNLRQLP